MNQNGPKLVEPSQGELQDCLADQPVHGVKARSIPCTDYPEAKPDEEFYLEWNTFRRELERLLANGQAGRYVLIKREELIGIFDTWDAAREAGLKRFLREPFFVHPLRAQEPYLRVRGLNFPCPS